MLTNSVKLPDWRTQPQHDAGDGGV